jgi:hypothetical protein
MESLGLWGLGGSGDQFRTDRGSIRGDQFGSCSRDSRSAFALEALAAEDGTSLCGFKGYGCLDTAFGAMSASLSAGEASRSRTRTRAHACTGAFGLARFASLGVVLELFVEEKELFAGSEDELSTAICTG